MTEEEMSASYWAGATRGVLTVQQCDRCGARRHYPRILCSQCHSFDASPVDLPGTGVVYSWTISHHVFDASVTTAVPYTLVTVDMAPGIRVLGRLESERPPVAGLRVVLDFEPDQTGRPLPRFTPAQL